ncbi:hypothetical protein COJ42_31145, partial [Bacillus cereus]
VDGCGVPPHAHQLKILYHPQNENFVHFARIYCLGITRSSSLMARGYGNDSFFLEPLTKLKQEAVSKRSFLTIF